MTTRAEAFAQARKHHQAGQFREAEKLYHQLLQATPQAADPQVWCLLGKAQFAQSRVGDALASWQQAIHLRADYTEALSLLGQALTDQGRCDEVVSHLRRALQQQPNDADLHYHLSQALARQGRLVQAVLG